MLKGKKIILAVTGSIAAYKATYIVRELIKSGASVRVIMTEASCRFITPLTLSTLSKNPVLIDFTKDSETGEWNNHVDMGLWADAFLVAPATANTLSKMVSGHADSFLMATFLSAKCPVFVAPAMDLDMFKHESTKSNLSLLKDRKAEIIAPESGELASGLVGEGRLAEPENIVAYLEAYFAKNQPLLGKKILITAGPTFEPIDPVRFIGNHSSGKMGYAIAARAKELGAEVTLVSGPTALSTPEGVNRLNITTANDLFETCKQNYAAQDIIIMAAAVADYTPKTVSNIKIKKKADDWSIELEKTVDVLKWVGENKLEKQFLVGFALETNNEEENALKKLVKKNLDFIVLNSLQDKGAGFKHDTNKITILTKENKKTEFELKTKDEVADDILQQVLIESSLQRG